MTDVGILVPVLRRPHRVKPLLESIRASAPDAHVVFITDLDDTDEQKAISREAKRLRDSLMVTDIRSEGSYAAKINTALRSTDEPLLFLAADDLYFYPEWLEKAWARMTDKIGVVGTNDLGNSRVLDGEHATHSLVARWYAELGTIDERGKLLCEDYDHNFCDTEMVATAKVRNAWDFAPDSIVEHLHPLWEKGEDDEVYRKGQEQFRRDQKRYRNRSRLIRGRRR